MTLGILKPSQALLLSVNTETIFNYSNMHESFIKNIYKVNKEPNN